MEIDFTPDEAASLLVAGIHGRTVSPNDIVLREAVTKIMGSFVSWAKENPTDFRYLVERLETNLLFQDGDLPLTNLDDVDTI